MSTHWPCRVGLMEGGMCEIEIQLSTESEHTHTQTTNVFVYMENKLSVIISVLFFSDSLTHGQDFSHMIAQPTIINVQLEDEDEKGIEVGRVTRPHTI